MEGIILEKFKQWVESYGSEEAKVALFKRVRDIPYAIVPELRDPLAGPPGILQLNKGSCQPKHYLLAIFLKQLGIAIKYASYPFFWQEQPIKYPDEFRALLKELPASNHLALKANINQRWVLVDAAYDLPLKKAGFPVNVDWDGRSDTINAVIPRAEILHDTPEQRLSFESGKRSLYTQEQKKASEEFIAKLNIWLVELRRG